MPSKKTEFLIYFEFYNDHFLTEISFPLSNRRKAPMSGWFVFYYSWAMVDAGNRSQTKFAPLLLMKTAIVYLAYKIWDSTSSVGSNPLLIMLKFPAILMLQLFLDRHCRTVLTHIIFTSRLTSLLYQISTESGRNDGQVCVEVKPFVIDCSTRLTRLSSTILY